MTIEWHVLIVIGVPVLLGISRGLVPVFLERRRGREKTATVDRRKWSHACAAVPATALAGCGFALEAAFELLVLTKTPQGLFGLLAAGIGVLLYLRSGGLAEEAERAGQELGTVLWWQASAWAVGALGLSTVVVLVRVMVV